MQTVLDTAGRIQLPDFVRTELGVSPGDLPEALSELGDLDWPDLDYVSVPPKNVRKLKVQFVRGGKLQPMLHPIDEE